MYLLLLLLHKESDLLYFPAPVFLNRLHAHHTYRGNHRNMEDGGRERERERGNYRVRAYLSCIIRRNSLAIVDS